MERTLSLRRIINTEYLTENDFDFVSKVYDKAQHGSMRAFLPILQSELRYLAGDPILVRYIMLTVALINIVVAYVLSSGPSNNGSYGAAVGIHIFSVVFLVAAEFARRDRRRLMREIAEIEARPQTRMDQLIVTNDFQRACHRVWLAQEEVRFAVQCWNAYVDRVELGLVGRFDNDEIVYNDISDRLRHVQKMALLTYRLYREDASSKKQNEQGAKLEQALDQLDFRLIDEMKSWYQGLTARHANAGFTTD